MFSTPVGYFPLLCVLISYFSFFFIVGACDLLLMETEGQCHWLQVKDIADRRQESFPYQLWKQTWILPCTLIHLSRIVTLPPWWREPETSEWTHCATVEGLQDRLVKTVRDSSIWNAAQMPMLFLHKSQIFEYM